MFCHRVPVWSYKVLYSVYSHFAQYVGFSDSNFIFNKYSYIDFYSALNFCREWIGRKPKNCAELAYLTKFRCYLVCAILCPTSFPVLLWVLSVLLAFLSLSSVYTFSFCSLAPRGDYRYHSLLHLLIAWYDTCAYTDKEAYSNGGVFFLF